MSHVLCFRPVLFHNECRNRRGGVEFRSTYVICKDPANEIGKGSEFVDRELIPVLDHTQIECVYLQGSTEELVD